MKKKTAGFTLLELMITLSVAAVLLSIAAPSFTDAIANNRAMTQANSLITAMNLVRNEAIKRGVDVSICPKSTADVTSTTCGTGGDWANGWFIFTDSGTQGSYDGTDVEIRHWEPLSGRATMTTSATYLLFQPEGAKLPLGETTIKLVQGGTSGIQDRCIRISTMGQIRSHLVEGATTCP